MPAFTNEEIETILKQHHTALLIMFPGSQLMCPGAQTIIREQKIQIGIGGCKECLASAIAGALVNNQVFRDAVVKAFHIAGII
jgi:hypothetical protein